MVSITAEAITKIGQIKDRLLDCSTREGVNSVFTEFGIIDFPVKSTLLSQTMQVKESFDVPSDKSVREEDIYEEELAFFLDGKWRELI